jgi:hypothetical protein
VVARTREPQRFAAIAQITYLWRQDDGTATNANSESPDRSVTATGRALSYGIKSVSMRWGSPRALAAGAAASEPDDTQPNAITDSSVQGGRWAADFQTERVVIECRKANGTKGSVPKQIKREEVCSSNDVVRKQTSCPHI